MACDAYFARQGEANTPVNTLKDQSPGERQTIDCENIKNDVQRKATAGRRSGSCRQERRLISDKGSCKRRNGRKRPACAAQDIVAGNLRRMLYSIEACALFRSDMGGGSHMQRAGCRCSI